MGYMRHHAIVVTSWDSESIEPAHKLATELGMIVTPIVSGAINGYRSFMVCPDGSKEGWTDSDAGDGRRDAFVAWLSTGDGDNRPWCDWAEVQYGDEEGVQGIVRASSWDRQLVGSEHPDFEFVSERHA